MTILVCGSRDWKDYQKIVDTLREYVHTNPLIIDGKCRGADYLAHEAAHWLDFSTRRYPAEWSKHGFAAGPIRNQQMLDEGRPDLVIAFHDNIEASKGTKDMVARAKKAGVKVRLVT